MTSPPLCGGPGRYCGIFRPGRTRRSIMSQTLSERRPVPAEPATKSDEAKPSRLGHALWRAYRDPSRRRLFMNIFRGLGCAASVGVSVVLQPLFPRLHALALGAIASRIILPLSRLIGLMLWDLLLMREIRKGQPMSKLRYLEEEYWEDITRISNLPLSAEERAKRISKREDRSNRDRESVRQKLLNDHQLDKPTGL